MVNEMFVGDSLQILRLILSKFKLISDDFLMVSGRIEVNKFA